MEAVGSTEGDDPNIRSGQPVEEILVTCVEMFAASRGASHGVELVAIFLLGAGAHDAGAAGVPEIGVVQPEIMSQFMRADAQRGPAANPRARRADVTQARPVEAGDISKANQVELITA